MKVRDLKSDLNSEKENRIKLEVHNLVSLQWKRCWWRLR